VFRPDIIITHSGGATIPGFDPIIMDIDQTLELLDAAPEPSKVVAVHLESLDHCGVSRDQIRRAANKKDIPSSKLIIPDDGEKISL
jgi:hypothetical protein